MPRKSVASLSVISPSGMPNRLHPPAFLSAPERAVFVDIVAQNEPTHFRPSDSVLLCRYVEHTVMAERAAKELRKSAVINGKLSPWVTVQEKAVRAMVSLSMRLRLSPQARQPNNAGPRPKPLSAYERMRIDDGE